MAQLSVYKTLEEKKEVFKKDEYFIIDTSEAFDKWYKWVSTKQNEASKKVNDINFETQFEDTIYNHYPFIFRGIGDAKYKIFSSAQRDWNLNDMSQWAGKSYLEYVNDIVKKAASSPLLAKVFNYYKLRHNQVDFPTLSILQHYGAPTPLIDFTYSLDVALYFATEFCQHSFSNNIIDQYFSVNMIDRSIQGRNEFLNLLEFSSGAYSNLSTFYPLQESSNTIFYITDFENNYSRRSSKSFNDQRPLTILFNQRIIPQEGLFVFNPSPKRALEEGFGRPLEGSNLHLKKMLCVNIKKDLSDYIRRKINLSDIDKLYIYPQLDDYSKDVKNKVLNELVKARV